jgi:hypothetical protein
MEEQALRQLSTEILTDIKEWRTANPRATYVQIEDEVHKRLMHLEARLIENAVEQSPSQEWGRGSLPSVPRVLLPYRHEGNKSGRYKATGEKT